MRLLDLDAHGAASPRRVGGLAMAHVVLDGHLQREQQLALRVEQVDLRVRRQQLVDGGSHEVPRVTEESAGAHAALLGQLLALPKTTRSIPSSSFAAVTVFPLSTRG